jgi:hypothetical protein
MNETRRHWSRNSSRSTLSLLSVLALLAFACFPVAAQADSAGAQYEVAIKGPGNKPTHKNEQIAEKSESPGRTGGATAPPTTGGGGGSGSGEYSGEVNGEAPSSGSGPSGHHQGTGTGNGGGKGQGSPEKGATPKGGAHLQPAAPTSSPASDSGGSSPLVPILIVIGALALISIGAFVIRQRRQRGGGSASSLSTKAG